MRRRRFIENVGAAAGGLSLWPAARRIGLVPPADEFRLWTWVHGNDDADDQWRRRFGRLKTAGFHGVLVSGGEAERLAAAAHQEGLVFHRWIWVLNRNGDAWVREHHPEWFTVNRRGESTLDHPPYVDYYRWVCPRREPVREYLQGVVGDVARTEGVDGVHLDYIRYPDVILPVALWSKYGLVQDRELPEFDNCYCDVCRATFAERTGIDPMELEDAPSDLVWRAFRWESVSLAVEAMADTVHREANQITAAVFPTPTVARRLVRQAWETWPLDAVFPMIYHSFYQEPVEWIGRATEEGVSELQGERPLYSGLYLPDLTPPELAEAVVVSRDAGAAGVALFESNGITDAHLDALEAVRQPKSR